MPIQSILLGSGPDTTGSESLYSGFSKVNNNYVTYQSTEGASLIGYNNSTSGYTSTNVQDVIDEISAASGQINHGQNLGAGEGQVYSGIDPGATNDLQFRSLKKGTGINITQTSTEVTISSTVSSDNIISVKNISGGTDYTHLNTDELLVANPTTATFNINLLDLSPVPDNGLKLYVKNINTGTNVVTLTPGTKNIDQGVGGGAASTTPLTIYPGGAVQIVYDVTNTTWWII